MGLLLAAVTLFFTTATGYTQSQIDATIANASRGITNMSNISIGTIPTTLSNGEREVNVSLK